MPTRLAAEDRALLLRIAAGVALFMTVSVAALHYFRGASQVAADLGVGEDPRSYGFLFAIEIPVWFGWVAMVPAILRLADAFPVAGRRWSAHLAVHLLALCLTILLGATIVTIGRWPFLGVEPGGFLVHVAVYVFFAVPIYPLHYVLTLLGHHVLSHARRLGRQEVEEARRQEALTRARLQALQGQMQPHFLFNALNGISGLIGRDDRRARNLIADLGVLLRQVVEGERAQEVSLADELALLDRYVSLQRARFGDRLRLSSQVPAEALALLVPRLALQPLVENAVHHAVERRQAPVEVRLQARVDGERLVLTVADDGPGLRPGAAEGVGLGNLRERLRMLYGDAQSLAVAARPGGGTTVTVTLPAIAAPAPARRLESAG
jgi:sensor histidine kinase YesM